ncbi:MAG TPA: CDP-diacylglycerol--glycerol-3-phosphate 3-phosphatidyltransferase [Rhodobacteraceae bacterium]|jgi:phosphatidylglycerophosphate synthase|nr:CDP-diacylglycerol--glycerol-3-phosphate 3-phosphatidyltransferase [Paracoccaceae bacterium]
MANETDRRPLASRNTGWAKKITQRLAQTSITPNQISIASMIAAAIAGLLFFMGGQTDGFLRVTGLLGAALFCQLRLICNLLDGMVAVEAGKGSSDGAFWNEMPDRVSDVLILAGIGYAIGDPALGWATASFAVMTAYVRELGRASGRFADFCGPMAKPHRMATATFGAIIAVFLPDYPILEITIWIILTGTIITVFRRSARLLQWFNNL